MVEEIEVKHDRHGWGKKMLLLRSKERTRSSWFSKNPSETTKCFQRKRREEGGCVVVFFSRRDGGCRRERKRQGEKNLEVLGNPCSREKRALAYHNAAQSNGAAFSFIHTPLQNLSLTDSSWHMHMEKCEKKIRVAFIYGGRIFEDEAG